MSTSILRLISALAFALLLAALLPWAALTDALALNRLAVFTAQRALPNSRPLVAAGEPPSGRLGSLCRARWLQGFLVGARGDLPARDRAWEASLRCDPRVVPLLQIKLPQKRAMAALAVQARPESPAAWFWLANTHIDWIGGWPRLSEETERAQTIEMYLQGLKLSPRDGLRWRELGDLLLELDPQAAVKAYLQSCRHGDPGSNGCWRAGQTAERLDDPETAIRYYRLSRWEGALNRASQLEEELLSRKNP